MSNRFPQLSGALAAGGTCRVRWTSPGDPKLPSISGGSWQPPSRCCSTVLTVFFPFFPFPYILRNSSRDILIVFGFHQFSCDVPAVDLTHFFFSYLELRGSESITCRFHRLFPLQILFLFLLLFCECPHAKPSHCILSISYPVLCFPSELESHRGQ